MLANQMPKGNLQGEDECNSFIPPCDFQKLAFKDMLTAAVDIMAG